MRQMISGMLAAVAVVAAGAAPAMACGYNPCAPAYIPAPVYSGCDTGCGGGLAYERLPDPVQQYYYVNQGPTYTGPGDFAPYPTYQEGTVYGWHGYRHHRHHYGYGYGYNDGETYEGGSEGYGYRAYPRFHAWHTHHGFYGYPQHHSIRYEYTPYHSHYTPHYGLPPRPFYAPHKTPRYGGPIGMPHHEGYGFREHTPRRYY